MLRVTLHLHANILPVNCRADEVIVSTSGEDIPERVKEITGGKGAYAAMDAVAGALTAHLLSATRASGKLLIYGLLSGPSFTGSVLDVLAMDKVQT